MARKRKDAIPTLPDPINLDFAPLEIDTPGWWLILSDIHIPYHDRAAIECAVQYAKSFKPAGVLLNGDILDSHQLSRFDKTPDDPRYVSEVEAGQRLLAYLRHNFQRSRLVWKEGNHEERLFAYLINQAPALFGLPCLSLPRLLDFVRYGVEFVGDRRVISLGKIHVIHGHEYRPGIQAPVNPARGLFLRTKSNSLCGHFHQTSEHHEPTIARRPMGAWSTGCLCNLSPRYMPLNKWNVGFAMVRLSGGGNFEVRNLRLINGEIV